MKFVSLLVASMAAYTTQAATPVDSGRGLQTLKQKWNITDPTFAYDGLAFDLDYVTSDFIGDTMSKWELYDEGCREDGTLLGDQTTPSNLMSISKTSIGATGPGTGTRDVELDIAINSQNIPTQPLIYSEALNADDQLIATVRFCVRLSVYTPDDSIEVNFLETLVTLYVDLTDGFEINDVAVAPKIKEEKTATQVYEVEAYQCNAANANLTLAEYQNTRNQGSTIKVCVRPTLEGREDGIYMREILNFDWVRDAGTLDEVTQPAIVGSAAAPNGLTEMDCASGYSICSFETILFANFYRVSGVVSGSGVANMQFGTSTQRRALRSGSRAVQEAEDEVAASAEFGLSLDLLPTADTESSDAAGRSGLFAMTVVAVMGAASIL